MMNTANLLRCVRDPRSGEVHHPSEEVTIIGVMRNLGRTPMKVRWQAGGDCIVFPEGLGEAQTPVMCFARQSPSAQSE